MVFDTLKNKELYYPLNKNFKAAFNFIEEYLEHHHEVGKYTINDSCYAMVQEYNSKETGACEAHDSYIDIQYIVRGSEKMYFADRSILEVDKEYNPEKDVVFLKDTDKYSEITAEDGSFAIFFPGDAHKPGMKNGTSGKITKIVVKIKVQ